MGIAAPVIVSEMNDWVARGGGNSGIVGNAAHDYGFHLAANEIPPSDYSREQDPNGAYGPFVNWDYACAGDFDHKNDENLRAQHRDVLARLMRGEMPMICEFIGKPWADRPVMYWARWNGVQTLQRYTGAGHDHWSHISWYRSRVDERANLWSAGPSVPPDSSEEPAWLRRPWPGYMPKSEWFGDIDGPNASHGGWNVNERPDVKAIQESMSILGFDPGPHDGIFGPQTIAAVSAWQARDWASTTELPGQVWIDDWYHMFTR